jgi:uncharacterized damage-inducible protein DinB
METAKGMTMHAAEMLCKDAAWIPDDKKDWNPKENAKSVNQILSECARGNFRIAAAVKGATPGEISDPADFVGLKNHVIDSAKEFCSAIDSLDESGLEKEIMAPWGQPMSLSALIFLPASHMTYHDGQVNYIQLLLGDTKFHWRE